MEDLATNLEEMEQEAKKVTKGTMQFWGTIVQDEKLEQLTKQLQEEEGYLVKLKMKLREIPPVFQITRFAELKELQQHIRKAREIQQRTIEKLDEFQDLGAHLSAKVVAALKATQEGKKEVVEKMVEHPFKHNLTGSQEIAEQVKEQVKVISQQYDDFKMKINKYSMSI